MTDTMMNWVIGIPTALIVGWGFKVLTGRWPVAASIRWIAFLATAIAAIGLVGWGLVGLFSLVTTGGPVVLMLVLIYFAILFK